MHRCVLWLLVALLGSACASTRATTPNPSAHASQLSPPPEQVPQVCRVRHGDGAWITLTMELLPRPKLMRECQRVADYLALPKAPLPPFAASEAEAALRRLGYFKDIRCNLTDPGNLSCAMVSIPIVRSVKIRGHLPMALLEEDVRRRVSLRPGALMPDMTEALHRQALRLESYLRGEGYFDAVVALTPRRVRGTGLNQDVHLDIDVSARSTAKVRRIQFEGDPILPTQKLAWPFWQRGFLGIPRPFRPSLLADNVEAATQLLRDQGYVGAHLQASFTHHPEAKAVDVTVRVAPGRRVHVHFVGNTVFSDRRLRLLAPFAASGAVDAVAVEELRMSIVRLYQEKGYAEVDVQASIGRSEGRDIEVTYIIDAGERYSVTAVVFKNAGLLQPALLMHEGKLLQRPSSRWTRRRWVDAFVQHDESYLTGLLRAQGLAEATVTARKKPGAWPNSLTLTYDIDLGPSRRVVDVAIEGAPDDVDVAQLKKHLKMRAGGPFVSGGIESDVSDIEGKLATLGYITASVQATLSLPSGPSFATEQALIEATRGNTTGTAVPVSVRYTLAPGPQARLGGIFIHGNFRTRSRTLLQEMNTRVGQPINLAAVGAARRSLRNLNLFNAVQLTPAHSSLGTSHTWLVLAVEERNVRSLEAVGAFSSDFRFSVGADFKDANVLGRAMLLTLTARLANANNLAWHPLRIGDQDLLEARLRAPHPFGWPLTTEASAMYRYRDVHSYRERRLTGQAALIKPVLSQMTCRLCPDVTTRLTYELTEAYFWDKSNDNNPATMPSDPNVGATTIARIIPKVTLSRRDSPTDPRRGTALDAAFEVAHPVLAGNLGERASAFMRVLVGAQGFVPLGKPVRVPIRRGWVLGGPLILATATSFNMALPYGRRGGVPTSESFGYGGDLSVRGLRNRASTIQLDDAHFMFTASAELRWYALEHLGPGDLQLAAFIDSGTVAATAKDLYGEHTLSLGPALRYVTPFGPVSLAYGKAVVLPPALWGAPREAPRKGRVHITFGYAF